MEDGPSIYPFWIECEVRLDFLLLVSALCPLLPRCNERGFFSDLTVALDKAILLEFVYTLDIPCTYDKPCEEVALH